MKRKLVAWLVFGAVTAGGCVVSPTVAVDGATVTGDGPAGDSSVNGDLGPGGDASIHRDLSQGGPVDTGNSGYEKVSSPDGNGLIDADPCTFPPCTVQEIGRVTREPDERVRGLRASGDHLYGALYTPSRTRFFRVPKNGFQAVEPVGTNTSHGDLRDFAVDPGGQSIWYLAIIPEGGGHALWHLNMADGMTTMMASTGTPLAGQSLAVDDQTVFWLEVDSPNGGSVRALSRVQKGATPQPVGTFNTMAPAGMVQSTTHLFGSSCAGGCQVWSLPKDDAEPPTTLGQVAGPTRIVALTADDENGRILFATDTGELLRVPQDGSAAATFVAATNGLTDRLVVTSYDVYWLADSVLWKAAQTAGAPAEAVVEAGDTASGLVLDEQARYWLASAGQAEVVIQKYNR